MQRRRTTIVEGGKRFHRRTRATWINCNFLLSSTSAISPWACRQLSHRVRRCTRSSGSWATQQAAFHSAKLSSEFIIRRYNSSAALRSSVIHHYCDDTSRSRVPVPTRCCAVVPSILLKPIPSPRRAARRQGAYGRVIETVIPVSCLLTKLMTAVQWRYGKCFAVGTSGMPSTSRDIATIVCHRTNTL